MPPTDTVPVWWEQETVIYAQRVLSTGGVLWALDGIPVVDLTRPISEVFYLHSQPAVAADGVGGALIGFLNDAGDFPGVYVQRINAEGEMVWRDRYRYGHEIANKDEDLMDILVMAGDGVEGAIVVWGLYTDKGGRLYAQRVGKSGDKVWESSVPLFTNFQNDTAFDPRVVSDGLGGVIIVWRDYRSGVNPGVYAQRLNKDGNRLWGVDGVPVPLAPATMFTLSRRRRSQPMGAAALLSPGTARSPVRPGCMPSTWMRMARTTGPPACCCPITPSRILPLNPPTRLSPGTAAGVSLWFGAAIPRSRSARTA